MGGTYLATASRLVRRPDPGIVFRAAGSYDRAAVASFIARLSPESRYHRFLHALRTLPDALLDGMLRFHPARAVTLLWFDVGAAGELVGIAQYAATYEPGQCEIGIVVAEAWQRRGLGSLMLDELARIALLAGFRSATAETLTENVSALQLARRWGAQLALVPGNAQLTAIRAPLDRRAGPSLTGTPPDARVYSRRPGPGSPARTRG